MYWFLIPLVTYDEKLNYVDDKYKHLKKSLNF